MQRVVVAALSSALVVASAACSTAGSSPGRAGRRVPSRAVTVPAGRVATPRAPTPPPPTVPPTTLPPITPPQPGDAHVVAAGPTTGPPRVALTFDDGFCDECVGTMVAAVARTRVPVTFCPNGRYAAVWERYAPFIRVLIAQGLVQICNHTLDHLTLTQLSDDRVRYEIQANEDWIERTFGVSSRPFLRPPGGTYDSRVAAIAGQLGFTVIVYWSATLSDSSPQPPSQVLGATDRCARPGAIVLGHVNYPTTADAFDQLVAIVRSHGVEPVTVAGLLYPDPAATGTRADPQGACT